MTKIFGNEVCGTFGVVRELLDDSLSYSFGYANTKNFHYINPPTFINTRDNFIYYGIFETKNKVWCRNKQGEKMFIKKNHLKKIPIVCNQC